MYRSINLPVNQSIGVFVAPPFCVQAGPNRGAEEEAARARVGREGAEDLDRWTWSIEAKVTSDT